MQQTKQSHVTHVLNDNVHEDSKETIRPLKRFKYSYNQIY